MKRMAFVAIFGLFVTTGLCALCVDTPSSAPHIWATMAWLNKKGQVVLKCPTFQNVPVTATRVLRDGKEVEEKHTFYEAVTGWEYQTYDPNDIKLLGSDGRPLDKKILPELLKKARPVLYMYGDNKIDSTFLKVIKEETPILLLPLSDLKPG